MHSTLRIAALLVFVVSSTALAQVGICKPGVNCTSTSFYATGGRTVSGRVAAFVAPPNVAICTDQSCTGFIDTNTAGGFARWVYSTSEVDLGSGYLTSNRPISVPDGTAAAPAFTWTNDADTGFYRVGANQLGVATAGARSFSFNATAGTLEGTSASPVLTLNDATGAKLQYGAQSFLATSNTVEIVQPTGGLRFSNAVAPTTFGWPGSFRGTLNVDGFSGRAYWGPSGATATTPPVDFGGGAHPVMQQRVYALDMGYESTATPTFYPVAPRVGASAATVTVVDAAAASTATLGASPNQVDARGFVTTAAAGSLSSLSTTAFIRKVGHAPRFCAKVSLSTTSNIRVWLGIANALPGATDNPANGAVSWRYSTTAADTKWQYCYANGVSTTCSSTNTSLPSSGTGSYDLLCIDCREGLSTACTFWANGVAQARITSGLPTGAPFFPYFSVEARSAAAVTGYLGPTSVEIN